MTKDLLPRAFIQKRSKQRNQGTTDLPRGVTAMKKTWCVAGWGEVAGAG